MHWTDSVIVLRRFTHSLSRYYRCIYTTVIYLLHIPHLFSFFTCPSALRETPPSARPCAYALPPAGVFAASLRIRQPGSKNPIAIIVIGVLGSSWLIYLMYMHTEIGARGRQYIYRQTRVLATTVKTRVDLCYNSEGSMDLQPQRNRNRSELVAFAMKFIPPPGTSGRNLWLLRCASSMRASTAVACKAVVDQLGH